MKAVTGSLLSLTGFGPTALLRGCFPSLYHHSGPPSPALHRACPGRLKASPGWNGRRLALASGQPLLSAFRLARVLCGRSPRGWSAHSPHASTAPRHARSLSADALSPVTLTRRDAKAVLSASAPPRAPAQALLLTHLSLRVESLQSRPLH